MRATTATAERRREKCKNVSIENRIDLPTNRINVKDFMMRVVPVRVCVYVSVCVGSVHLIASRDGRYCPPNGIDRLLYRRISPYPRLLSLLLYFFLSRRTPTGV